MRFLLIFVLGFASVAVAQSSGSVSGQVMDPTGATTGGVSVLLNQLVKPFGRQELLARVQALLRRSASARPPERETYDDGTIFLLWQGRVPTVIGPSQLKAGDRITVRIRAPRESSLAQVEATPAAHVGDHEPAPAAEE